MPNHVHFVLMFENQPMPSEIMRDFKKFTSRHIRYLYMYEAGSEFIPKLIYQKGEQKFKVWMDRFDLKIVLSPAMLLNKVKYIHENPLKKGLVEKEEDWKYSSSGLYKFGFDNNLPVRNYAEILF